MYKLCLLVACLVCAGDGLRLKATLGSRLNGKASRSESGQFAKNIANPTKIVPILLTFFSPGVVFAPSSKVFTTGAVYNAAEEHIPSNPNGANAGPGVVVLDQDYVEEAFPYVNEPIVSIVVSVGWQGSDLREKNLRFFEDFREAHPEVPLTHFLNAAYFTKSGPQSFQQWSPHEALSPIDDHGLLIQSWKSLVEASGVQYRSGPDVLQSLEGWDDSLAEEEHLWNKLENWDDSSESPSEKVALQKYLIRDVGYDTDIRAYSVDELQKIISKSKAILEKQGLKVGTSFRVGERLAGPNVLEAFRREGFRVNSSALRLDDMIARMPPEHGEVWKDAPLTAMLRELWPDITSESQPFLLETPAGWVLEMPDTGTLADFATVEDMVNHIDVAVQQLDSQDRFAQIGFHQENAAAHGPKVAAAITEIKQKHGHRVVFETLEASARRTRSMQQLEELERLLKLHGLPIDSPSAAHARAAQLRA